MSILELPREILITIVCYLDLKAIIAAAQVSKLMSEICLHDELWRRKLLINYYFTEGSVINFQKKKRLSYKELFKYCLLYAHNKTQKKCLQNPKLQLHGITRHHLAGRDWFNQEWYEIALCHLLTDSSLSLPVAIAELSNLQRFQVAGIANQFSMLEVKQLKSISQLRVLIAFKDYGLKIHHIENEINFTTDREAALKKLLAHGFDMDEAIRQLTDLNDQQAWAIAEGISRAEVLVLNNIWQMRALVKFQNYGFKAEHFNGTAWFSLSDEIRLKGLLDVNNSSPEQAMLQLKEWHESERLNMQN